MSSARSSSGVRGFASKAAAAAGLTRNKSPSARRASPGGRSQRRGARSAGNSSPTRVNSARSAGEDSSPIGYGSVGRYGTTRSQVTRVKSSAQSTEMGNYESMTDISSVDYISQEERRAKKREQDESEREFFISHLTEEDFSRAFGFKWWKTRVTRVDFSSDKFRLETLVGPFGGLLNKKLNLSKCTFIDVSFNRLYDINVLQKANGLENLEVLIARCNHLTAFNLRLPKLCELNLSYNDFRTPPSLEGLPFLQVLILHHNRMNGDFPNVNFNIRLQRLDLGENEYELLPSELRRNLELIGELPDLSNLRLINNPFIAHFQEYQVFVVHMLPMLLYLDEVKIGKGMRRELQEANLLALDNYDEVYESRKKEFQTQKGKASLHYDGRPRHLPRLQAINEQLLGIIEDASLLIANVEKILEMVTCIPQPYFTREPDPEGIFWMTQVESKGAASLNVAAVFFEMISSVLDRHEFTRDQLVKVLCYLCCISSRDFGFRCTEYLGSLMLSGQAALVVVLKGLAQVVVPNLLDLGKHDVSSPNTSILIRGLVHLLGISELRSEVAKALGEVVPYSVTWFKASQPQDNRRVTQLLAYLTETERNMRNAADQELVDRCLEYVNDQSLQEHAASHDLWLDLLRLLRNVIKFCPDNLLDGLVRAQVHVLLISRARAVRRRGMNEAEVQSLTWSEIVYTLTALMERRREVLIDSCRSFKYVTELGENMQEFVVDPLVLTAACKSITLILKEKELLDDFGQAIVNDLSGVTPLLLYLGQEKYPGLWDRAQRHHARERDRPFVASEGQQHPPLEQLRDPICVEAFLAIIELIEFFADAQKEVAEEDEDDDDEKDAATTLVESVNEAMNNNQRETILLGLLVLPLDEVKTAVMQCISKMPTSQLERQELGLIIKLLLETRNISAGNLEGMLSKAILLLDRVAGQLNTLGASFRRDQGELALLASHSVLCRNAERSTYGSSSEEEEKSNLSLMIVQFLRTCSQFHPLRLVLQTNQKCKETLPQLLKLEEELHRPEMPDISIELTWTGRSVLSLMQALSGEKALDPEKKQALRVIMRLADIFEGRPEEDDHGPGPTLRDLCAREVLMWDTPEILKFSLRLDDMEDSHRREQIKVFTLTRAVARILSFITRPSSADADLTYAEQLLETQKELLAMRQGGGSHEAFQTGDLESSDQFQTDGDEAEETSGTLLKLEVGGKAAEQEGQQILLREIQCHEYKPKDEVGHKLHHVVISKRIEDIFIDEQKGVINYVYVLSATMRLLHALIVASPKKLNARTDYMPRANTLAELRQPFVIKLFLAELSRVPPTSCNVAAKFLRLMTVVFRAIDVSGGAPRLELFGLLRGYVADLSRIVADMVDSAQNKPMNSQRQHLCAELASFMETMVQLGPYQENPRHSPFNNGVTQWLVPRELIKIVTEMILYDVHSEGGTAFGANITRELVHHMYTKAPIRQMGTRCLAVYLAPRPIVKYDILYKFSKTAVFNGTALPRAYLNELLSRIDLCKYVYRVESCLHERSGDYEEFVFQLLPVWVVKKHRPLAWMHMLICATNRAIYLIAPDVSKPPYMDRASNRWEPSWEACHPRDPAGIEEFHYDDIVSLSTSYGYQILSIQWKRSTQGGASAGVAGVGVSAATTPACDLYIFESTGDRDLFVQSVQNIYSAMDSDLCEIPYDPAVREEVQKYTQNDEVLVATVTAEGTQLRLWVLTVKEVLEIQLQPTSIRPPLDAELGLDDGADFFNPMKDHGSGLHAEATTAAAGGAVAPGEVKAAVPATASRQQGDKKTKAAAAPVPAQRMTSTASRAEASLQTSSSRSTRASGFLSAPRNREPLKDLQEIVFETDGNPDLMLKFRKGTQMQIKFFEEEGRFRWRRALAYRLASGGSKGWHRQEDED